jgi:hypothetical protein
MVHSNHLVTQHENHVLYELKCPVCQEDLKIMVQKDIANEIIRYPFEFVDIHGTTPHGLTLYIDKHWNVRGMEIFKNINLPEHIMKEKITRMVPVIKAKISPMAKELGILSKKEYKILENIDGHLSVDDISKNIEQSLEYTNDILRKLADKKIISLQIRHG